MWRSCPMATFGGKAKTVLCQKNAWIGKEINGRQNRKKKRPTRKDEAGNFLWPGFGENMRVLKWIVDRCHGRIGATESELGWIPRREDFETNGLKDFGPEQFEKAQEIKTKEWEQEVVSQEELFV